MKRIVREAATRKQAAAARTSPNIQKRATAPTAILNCRKTTIGLLTGTATQKSRWRKSPTNFWYK